MSTEQNKRLVLRIFDEIYNRNNLAAVDELISEEYVYRKPGSEVHGPTDYKQLIAYFRAAFPDMQFSIDQMIAEGEYVVCRWTFTGTHGGEYSGVAATGKFVTVTGIVVSRCVDGKLVEDVEVLDELGLLRQIGAMPVLQPA